MFTIVETAVASQSTRTSKYADLVSKLATATKNEDGTFNGQAVEVEKIGEVQSIRLAAKVIGVGIITRKQPNGKTLVWKVAKNDLTPRKTSPASKGKTKKTA